MIVKTKILTSKQVQKAAERELAARMESIVAKAVAKAETRILAEIDRRLSVSKGADRAR